MSEWQEVKLNTVTSYIKRGVSPKYVEIDGHSIINQKCIRNNRVTYKDSKLLSKTQKIAKEKYLQDGDVLVNSTGVGTLGRVAQYKKIGVSVFCDSHVSIVRANELIDKVFLAHQLSYKESAIENYGKGATNQIELSSHDLGLLKINLPPLPTQQKIAKTLSNYDDLIENNLKRIKLLEESARLTYEGWFLRFRIDGKKLDIDPETKLPFGWKKVKVNSLVSYYIGGGWGEESISDDFSDKAYVIRGTDINDIPYGNLEGAPLRCHKASNLASRKLQNKDIIFEVSGGSKTEGVAKTLLMTDNLLEQFNNDVMCASFCKLVRPKEQCLGNLLHLSFKYLRNSKATEVFEIKSASSIINYNWEAFIKHQDLIMPSHDVLLNFDKKVDVLVNEIYNLGHQNQLLQEARDILLPRLMTNVIDTDELDIAV